MESSQFIFLILLSRLRRIPQLQTSQAGRKWFQAPGQKDGGKHACRHEDDEHGILESVVAMEDVLRAESYRRGSYPESDQVQNEQVNSRRLSPHVGWHHLLDRR